MPFNRDHDPRLIAFAREMRRKPSDAERRLWWLLRREKLAGYRFRRQVPLAGYIADFCCLAEKLVVEVDGAQHGEADAARYDQERTVILTAAGFRVLRFWAHDVLKHTDAVGLTILRELGASKPGPKTDPPS